MDIDSKTKIAYDEKGSRIVKCDICNKTADSDVFLVYGGIGTVNRGYCRACIVKQRSVGK